MTHQRPDDTPPEQVDDPVVLVLRKGRFIPKAAPVRTGTVQEHVRAALERQRQRRGHEHLA